MSSSRKPCSSTPTPSVKLEIQDHTADQVAVFTPRPIIIPSTHSLPRMMKMAANSKCVPKDYMDIVDVQDIVNKARQSDASSSRLLPLSKQTSIWQFMSLPGVRLPYRTSL